MVLELENLLGPRWREGRYVLAVSGGVDSMAMLGLFAEAVPASHLIVAHFDHRVRKDSWRSRDLVRDTAKSRGLRFLEEARRGKGESEAALRKERRAFLEKLVADEDFNWIVTAHHAQDQLETILMRLIRGTGMQGLKGIAPIHGKWLRPFLATTKDELAAAVRMRKIPVHRDSTNDSRRYFRNRVRQDLVPAFAELAEMHGGMKEISRRLAGLTAELREWDRKERRQLARKVDSHVVHTEFWYRWPESAWRKLSPTQQARWLRQNIETLSGEAPTRRGIEKFRAAIDSRQKRFQGENQVEVIYSCEQIFFQSVDQRLRLRNAQAASSGLTMNLERTKAYRGATLRYRKPGDRFQGRKLKELLLEERIPRPERDLLPVIALPQSSEVLWYFGQPGFSLDDFDFPFSSSTK